MYFILVRVIAICKCIGIYIESCAQIPSSEDPLPSVPFNMPHEISAALGPDLTLHPRSFSLAILFVLSLHKNVRAALDLELPQPEG